MARKFSELRAQMSPERQASAKARANAILQEMSLTELRKAREFTQAALAEALDSSQGDVSKLEQRTDWYVSTIRSYIEAMGGTLEIVARFPDKQDVKIRQFAELAGR